MVAGAMIKDGRHLSPRTVAGGGGLFPFTFLQSRPDECRGLECTQGGNNKSEPGAISRCRSTEPI